MAAMSIYGINRLKILQTGTCRPVCQNLVCSVTLGQGKMWKLRLLKGKCYNGGFFEHYCGLCLGNWLTITKTRPCNIQRFL